MKSTRSLSRVKYEWHWEIAGWQNKPHPDKFEILRKYWEVTTDGYWAHSDRELVELLSQHETAVRGFPHRAKYEDLQALAENLTVCHAEFSVCTLCFSEIRLRDRADAHEWLVGKRTRCAPCEWAREERASDLGIAGRVH